VDRGIRVYLLTTGSGLYSRESFGPALALAGVVTRHLPAPRGSEAVILDRKRAFLIRREYVAVYAEPVEEKARVDRLVEEFYRAFLSARVFDAERWAYELYIREYLRR